MKRLTVFLLLITFTFCAEGQHVNILYNARVETFKMQSLKDLQLEQVGLWSVRPALLEDMPVRLTGSFSFESNLNSRWTIGVNPGYSSTGSRYYYEDYSGVQYNDFVVNRYDLTASMMYRFSPKRITPFVILAGGVNLNELDLDLYTRLGPDNPADTIRLSFRSVSLGTRFGAGIEKQLKFMLFRLTGLYELTIPGQFKLKENSDFKLLTNEGNTVDAGWEGFKIMFSAGVRF